MSEESQTFDEIERDLQLKARYLMLQRGDDDIRNRYNAYIGSLLNLVYMSHKQKRHYRHDLDDVQRREHNLLKYSEDVDRLSREQDPSKIHVLVDEINELRQKLHELKYFTVDELDKISEIYAEMAAESEDEPLKAKLLKLSESYKAEGEVIKALTNVERLT